MTGFSPQSDDTDFERLVVAGHALAGHGLTDAFGHVSVRLDSESFLITPAKPLAKLTVQDEGTVVSLGSTELPDTAPKEAWIHLAIYAAHPETNAVARAQPQAVAGVTAAGHTIKPLHGHGAFFGQEVPLHANSKLIRDHGAALDVVSNMGQAPVIVLPGNGAVTRADTLAAAVALMWTLESSAKLNLAALGAGIPRLISDEDQRYWQDRSAELLPRIFRYLTGALSPTSGPPTQMAKIERKHHD